MKPKKNLPEIKFRFTMRKILFILEFLVGKIESNSFKFDLSINYLCVNRMFAYAYSQGTYVLSL